MNTKNQQDDQELESYLRGESAYSAVYATSKDLKSPGHLNTTIEQMAKEAVTQSHVKPGSVKRWQWPLALAATLFIVIALTVGLVMQQVSQPDLQVATTENVVKPTPSVREETSGQSVPAQIAETAPPNKVQDKPEKAITPAKPRQQLAGQETESVPEHLRQLLQPTGVSNNSQDNLPADEILRQWSRAQWVEQVKLLRAQNRSTLAQKYIDAYPRFYPQERLTDLLVP